MLHSAQNRKEAIIPGVAHFLESVSFSVETLRHTRLEELASLMQRMKHSQIDKKIIHELKALFKDFKSIDSSLLMCN